MDNPIQFLQHLGLALLMGSLIGLERERNHKEDKLHEFGGIRTMALVSMFGFLSYSLFGQNTALFGLLTAGYLALLVASYVMSSVQNGNSGATTEIAGLFTFLIGVLNGMSLELYATVVTLLTVSILYFKSALHSFARRVEKEELYDTLKFIAVAFVVLPLLPNQTYGPFSILNPYEIWFVVVLICSISFASYIGIKWLGPKDGIGLGGFLGGLMSSTAVALSFSHLSKKAKQLVDPFVFGILIAASAMFVRVLLTVSVVNRELLSHLWFPLFSMAVTGFLISMYFWFHKRGKGSADFSHKDLDLTSPFSLREAIKFGALFAAMLFITKFASVYLGTYGLYATALFSGTFDVDAITVSMAHLSAEQEITLATAATAVTIAAMTNTLSKGLLAFFLASPAVGRRTLLAMCTMIAVGLISLFISFPYGAPLL